MKALIIENNVIAQVVPDDAIFDVVPAWSWVTCPDDCIAYQWTYDGAVFSPPYIAPPQPETPEQIVARLELALDTYIDSQAQTYRYESIRTMVTYEDDPNPKFNAEGKGAKAFRSACYTLSIQLIGEVQAGTRPVPTEAELIALMPTLSSFVNNA